MTDTKYLIVVGGGAGTGKTTLARILFQLHSGDVPHKKGTYDEGKKVTVCECGEFAMLGRYNGSTQDGYGNVFPTRAAARRHLSSITPFHYKWLIAEGVAFGEITDRIDPADRRVLFYGLKANPLERALRVQTRVGRVTKASLTPMGDSKLLRSALRCGCTDPKILRSDEKSVYRIGTQIMAGAGGLGAMMHDETNEAENDDRGDEEAAGDGNGDGEAA